eukprot:g253.t1
MPPNHSHIPAARGSGPIGVSAESGVSLYNMALSPINVLLSVEWGLVVLLCLPVPMNELRGWVVNKLQDMWDNKALANGVKGVCLLSALSFVDSMRTLRNGELQRQAGNSVFAEAQLFRNQRNAALSGTSLGLMFVLWRLLNLQKKIYDLRKENKELLKAKQDVENKASSEGSVKKVVN